MSQGRKPEEKKRRKCSAEFKLNAVRRALAGERVAGIAEELGIRRKFIYAWKDRYTQLGEAGLELKSGRPRNEAQANTVEPQVGRGELLAARKRIAERERKVDQQELELDFFGEALLRVAGATKPVDAKKSTR